MHAMKLTGYRTRLVFAWGAYLLAALAALGAALLSLGGAALLLP